MSPAAVEYDLVDLAPLWGWLILFDAAALGGAVGWALARSCA